MSTIEAQLSSVSIEHNIQHDIEELFTECDDGDVSIVVGDEKLRAHKVILTARSPVFNAMFANKTTLESQKNEVNIEDLTSDVVRHILKYIYTDKIDDEAPIFDLFGAAEKYQLKGLKAKCAALIASNLHSQNAIDSLFYANLYGPKELKEFIIDYICVHDLDVEASTDFIKLAESSKTWSDLLVEVYVAQISKRRNKEE
uniref:BTB domain-containing protein n=1 Tax=Bracon brevicornis TaxID=1563983 RepID=A0A6V7I060_9HYME